MSGPTNRLNAGIVGDWPSRVAEAVVGGDDYGGACESYRLFGADRGVPVSPKGAGRSRGVWADRGRPG